MPKYKVGDYVTNKSDGWDRSYRVCKITKKTVWLWTGMYRNYLSFEWPDTLKKANIHFHPKHEELELRAYGNTVKPFKRYD